MGKYDPLRRYLEASQAEAIDVNFAQLEGILGFPLPQSAYRHQAWWANETHGSHSHSRSWQDAGWETSQVNTSCRTVRFERTGRRVSSTHQTRKPTTPKPDLWARAREITGIGDRDQLIETALRALIEREACRGLVEMGGTMPDIEAPPRRSFKW